MPKPTLEELNDAQTDWMDAEQALMDARLEVKEALNWEDKMLDKKIKAQNHYLNVKHSYEQD